MASNDPTFMRRVMRDARNNPADFEAAVRQYTGHDSRTVTAMIRMWQRLERGGALQPADTAVLQRAHPEVAHQIPEMVAAINKQKPSTRGTLFLGAVSGDTAVMQGRLHEAGSTFADLKQFVADFTREDMAASINAKREANTDPDIKARTIEKPQADPFDTRALLASQLGGREARLASDALEAGSPDAEVAMRSHLVGKAERAIERLEPDAKDESTGRDLSTRDSVAAAFDWHESVAVSEDLGYTTEEQP